MSKLDEFAKDYAKTIIETFPYLDGNAVGHAKDGFKAGALWLLEQLKENYQFETIIIRDMEELCKIEKE